MPLSMVHRMGVENGNYVLGKWKECYTYKDRQEVYSCHQRKQLMSKQMQQLQ